MGNIQNVMQIIDAFSNERDWGRFHTPVNLAKSISIEAAELLECYQWDDNAELAHVKEELADVLIYCFRLASVLELDPSEIIQEKVMKNAIKYPVEKNQGAIVKERRQ